MHKKNIALEFINLNDNEQVIFCSEFIKWNNSHTNGIYTSVVITNMSNIYRMSEKIEYKYGKIRLEKNNRISVERNNQQIHPIIVNILHRMELNELDSNSYSYSVSKHHKNVIYLNDMPTITSDDDDNVSSTSFKSRIKYLIEVNEEIYRSDVFNLYDARSEASDDEQMNLLLELSAETAKVRDMQKIIDSQNSLIELLKQKVEILEHELYDTVPIEWRCGVCFELNVARNCNIPCGHTTFCDNCINTEVCTRCGEKVDKILPYN